MIMIIIVIIIIFILVTSMDNRVGRMTHPSEPPTRLLWRRGFGGTGFFRSFGFRV